jgi:hypothetical protein
MKISEDKQDKYAQQQAQQAAAQECLMVLQPL